MSWRQKRPDAISASIREAAADWLARRDRGMKDHEEAEFAEWLTADERHERAFADAESAWDTLDLAAIGRPVDGGPDPDLLMPAGARFQAPAPPEGGSRAWKFLGPGALGLAAALVFTFFAWYRPTRGAYSDVVVTAVGQLQRVRLPDGSVITANTNSAIEIAYVAHERRINLVRGEASFAVAKNPQRPFIVSARGVAVRAVGTAFNVRLQAESVDVLVTEGRVKVEARDRTASSAPRAAPPLMLEAGRRISVKTARARPEPLRSDVKSVAPAEAARELAWREQRLEFFSTPLAEVVAQFNRYSRHQLVIDDPELGAMRFGGKFQPTAQDDFVRVLEANFPVVAERGERQTILRAAR